MAHRKTFGVTIETEQAWVVHLDECDENTEIIGSS
jgi:hypothetical protein